MITKKEDCVKVKLCKSSCAITNPGEVSDAYLVDGAYYDFKFTNEENPYGSRFVISDSSWSVLDETQTKEVEWVNGLPPVGVECWFNFKSKTPEKCKVKYIGRRVCVYENENGEEYSILLGCVDFSKIETKEEREKREELEAAYDLACAYNENDFVSAEEFKNYHPSLCDKWLAIVRKTGYRKGGE